MTENDEFGGSSDTPCFALLDGRVTDPDTEETSSFRIPLTKLPAVLGRSHDTDNPNFFGLGRRKALSRKQCVIYYQDAQGGCVEWDATALAYKKEGGSWNFQNAKLKTPVDELPKGGFFLIECLGRNSITVNRTKVEQGECMVLVSGSPIRISQHKLYFLLPTDAPPRKHLIEGAPSTKKAKKGVKRQPAAGSTSPSAAKKAKGTGLQAYTESLETMSTQELLDEMTNAIAANTWDRKNQMVGTVIVLRAVKDAAKAPEIMELAKDNGVARSRVIEWIEKSPKYKRFVEQLQSKIEPRSYQAAITKAVLKAGYTRNGTAGRYVKWHLPPTDSEEEEEGEGQEEQDEEEAGDDENEEEENEEEAQDDNDENEEEEEQEEEEEENEEGGDNDNDVDMNETEQNDQDEQPDDANENQEEEDEEDAEEEKVDDESNEMETDKPMDDKPQDDDDEEGEGSESNRGEDDVDNSLDVEDGVDGDEITKKEDIDGDEEAADEEEEGKQTPVKKEEPE